ncbi:hypothetical protein K8T06_03130, partial [bacterium]|nr:hypothetical protein [bacterium]
MATNPKRRQKKLEKRKKKRKIVKKSLAFNTQSRNKPVNYAEFPVHECLVQNSLFEIGLGNVVVTRLTSAGLIAVGAFVVDVYCLGVKNALFKVVSESE